MVVIHREAMASNLWPHSETVIIAPNHLLIVQGHALLFTQNAKIHSLYLENTSAIFRFYLTYFSKIIFV